MPKGFPFNIDHCDVRACLSQSHSNNMIYLAQPRFGSWRGCLSMISGIGIGNPYYADFLPYLLLKMLQAERYDSVFRQIDSVLILTFIWISKHSLFALSIICCIFSHLSGSTSSSTALGNQIDNLLHHAIPLAFGIRCHTLVYHGHCSRARANQSLDTSMHLL